MPRPLSSHPGLIWGTSVTEFSLASPPQGPGAWAPGNGSFQRDGPQAQAHHSVLVGESVLPLLLYSSRESPGPQVVICGVEVGGLLESPRPGQGIPVFSELRYINQQGAWLALGPVAKVELSDPSPSRQVSRLWFPVPGLHSLLFGIEMYFLHHNVHLFKMYDSVTSVYS